MEFFLSLSEVGVNSVILWFNNLVVYFSQSLENFLTPSIFAPQIIKTLFDNFRNILSVFVDMSQPVWLALLASLGPILSLVVVKNMFDIL